MTYRHEWKHIISLSDMITLQGRLPARLKNDNTDFINTLAALDGVNSAVLVSYNGNYMG